ncbi:MAG: LPS assembly protein LptD [Rickettsiales bacterium]|nr:LPS assembly protein LptD [Rickettsiales bacterium]
MKGFLLLFLFLCFNVSGKSGGRSDVFIIEGGKASSMIKNSTFSIDGGVRITRGEYNITSDSVTYDRENGKIFLDKKIRMEDGGKNKMFAEKAELSANLNRGVFENAGIILDRGISIVSERMDKDDDYNYFGYSSTYYFCPNRELDMDLSYDDIMAQIESNKIQIFSIYSRKSHVDRNRKRIYLDNVFLRFFNIPFFYLPHLTSSRELDIRVSGLSSPSLSKKSYYGYGFSIPIKLYFLDNLDIMLEPLLYQKLNFLLNSSMRFSRSEKFYMNFLGSYIYDNGQSKDIKNSGNISEQQEGVHKNVRMMCRSTVGAILDKETYLRGNMGYAADPYVLRDYFNDHRETLESNLSLFKITGKGYSKLDILSFQQIREHNNAGIAETPHFLALMEHSYASDGLSEGRNLRFYADASLVETLDSFRDSHRKYGRFSSKFALRHRNLWGGAHVDSNLALYSDFYYKITRREEMANSAISRIYPEFSMVLAYPVLVWDKIIINPKLQYFVSRGECIDILGIDSKNSELSINNLFSANRYGGNDILESGHRISYGLQASSNTMIGDFNVGLNQSYRNLIDGAHRINFFGDRFSHLIATFAYSSGGVYISYLSYLNSKSFGIDGKDMFLRFNSRRLSAGVFYRYRASDFRATGESKSQTSLQINYRLDEKIRFHLELGGNSKFHEATNLEVGLIYEDDCYLTRLTVARRNFNNFFDKNDASINFHFRIKN